MLTSLAPDCWEEVDEAVLICTAVADITTDVKNFVFEAPEGRIFEFEAGQFLTLVLDIDGQRVHRCYTISSAPTRPYRASITVKRVRGGPVSNWIHDNVLPGTKVTALAPLGAFTLTDRPAHKYLFLSAGSGITPLMSMIRTLHDLGSGSDTVFMHAARTPADIIFRHELAAMEVTMPSLRVIHVCEGDSPLERWGGLRGRLTADMLRTAVPDLHQRKVFTCGPVPYMASVRRILDELDFDRANYHEESFSFEDLPQAQPQDASDRPAPLDASADGVANYTVEFLKSGRSITCRSDQHILDAALEAGMRLASSCSQGMCGTCKLVKVGGEVHMQHNGGIRPKEVAAGKILICCSTPLSDLAIEG